MVEEQREVAENAVNLVAFYIQGEQKYIASCFYCSAVLSVNVCMSYQNKQKQIKHSLK